MAANRFRGEAQITGEQKSYLLRLGTRELCRLMDEFGAKTDAAVLQRIGQELSPEGETGINQRVLVQVVQACVADAPDEAAACDLIDDCGVEAVIDALSAAVSGRMNGGAAHPQTSARKKRSRGSGPSDLPTPPK